MSSFIAEAEVLIRPDTTRFRAELLTQITAATRAIPPITVPINVAASAAGVAAAAGATTALTTAQAAAQASTLGLASAEQVLNTTVARQVPLLGTAAAATTSVAGAQAVLEAQSKKTAASLLGVGTATGRLDAALLGLRSAFGGAAVIGLGAASLAAIVLGKSLRAVIGIASQTEETLNVFRATADATGREMEGVSRAARELGADVSLPGVSAADAAEAMTELARAGLDVQNSIDGARGVLQLATAAQIDNAAATELSASALNAFGLAGDQAVRVADVLAGAANEAQGGIDTMGIALQQAAAVARQVGFSLETTVAMLALLARNGLQGSDAGTSLRTALIRLINPTKQAQEAMEALGIEIRDFSGAIRPDVFDQFARATANMAPAARDAALATIFGQDAIRAAAILAREGADGFNEMAAAVESQGQAAELAGARTRGFSGDVGGLTSNLETLGGTLGTGVTSGLGGFARGLSIVVGGINSAVAAVDELSSSSQDLPDSIQEISVALAEATRQARSFGDNPPPRLIEDIEVLSQALRDELNPAFLVTARTADGYQVSLSDAAGRSVDVARASSFMSSSLADAATRMNLASQEADKLATALKALNEEQIRGQLQQQRTATARARAFGGEEEILQSLLAERERIDRILASQRAPRGSALENLLNERASITREIQSIQEQQASEKEAAARRIERAQSDADAAFLASLDVSEGRLRNRALEASATEALGDDIRAQVALRSFFRRSIEEVRKTVRDAQDRARAIAGLTRDLISANAEVARLQEEVRQERRRERQAARERERESLQLDIQLAETTGRTGAERRAREREIEFLQEQIRQTRRGSLQRKKLLLELRRAQKELNELTNETKATDTSARQFFDFLQTMQGFTANLLGNTIPLTATAGLVGRPSPTAATRPISTTPGADGAFERAVAAEGGAAEGRSRMGPTGGQVSTTNDILLRILTQLKSLNRAADSPEAIYQRKVQTSTMDGGGGNLNAM